MPVAPAHPPAPEPTGPYPPRYRRLRRWGLIAAAVLVALTTVRVWWGHLVAGRMAAEVAAIRARGEPVLPADFDPPEVPTADDAAAGYRAAAGSVALTPAQSTFEMYFSGTLPLTPAEARVLAGIVRDNDKALAAARDARHRPRRDGGPKVRTPVFFTLLPGLNSDRQLANLLKWAMQSAHTAGDDAEVIESAMDLLGLGPTVRGEGPLLICQLVAVGTDALLCDALDQITPDLAIEGDTAGPGTRPVATTTAPATGATTLPARPARPATRAQVRALIAGLLDESDVRRGIVRAMWGERMAVLDAEPLVVNEMPGPLGPLLRPASDRSILRLMRRAGQAADAVAEPDLPAATAKLPDPLSATTRADGQSRLAGLAGAVEQMLGSSSYGRIRQHYLDLAIRRMAAAALAVRLYRADHAGAWPASLGDLVPGYLPAVPADPLAAGGRPLVYLPPAPGREPILYSVGDDGVDDGGSQQVAPAHARRAPTSFRWHWKDAVLPLSRNPSDRGPTDSTAPPGWDGSPTTAPSDAAEGRP